MKFWENFKRARNAGKLNQAKKDLYIEEHKRSWEKNNRKISNLSYKVGKREEIKRIYEVEDAKAIANSESTKVDNSVKTTNISTTIDASKKIGVVDNKVKVPQTKAKQSKKNKK